MRSIPNRPAISNVLIKASANITFRDLLLTNPEQALTDMNLEPEDTAILTNVQAHTLKDYASQIKTKLLINYRP